MSFFTDLKTIGASAVNNIVSTAKKSAQDSADKASKALVPGLASDVAKGLDSIFRQVKARVVSEVARTPLAQEARQAEIERMTPQIIGAAVVVFIVGVVVAVFVFRRR